MTLQNTKVKILFFVATFISVILFFDWFFFSFLFLKFPNELEWDTSPWYNFLQKKETLSLDKNKKSILVTGSSVALYSYLPPDVDKNLFNSGIQSQSDFFGHVAMSPTDLYYYSNEIISKNPDIVLYLVNPGDFQIDYFPEKENGEFADYSEDARIHSYSKRHPTKYYYPLAFLKDHFFDLRKSEILPLLTKSLLFVNRYRSFIYDPIDAYLERHFRSGTSYHNYTGADLVPIQWRKGWTDQKFQVNCELKIKSQFSETVFIPEKDTNVKISYKTKEIYNNNFTKQGWQKIEFSIPGEMQAAKVELTFEIDRLVSSKAIDKKIYGKEYFYGIRLSQNFCKQLIESNISFTRLDSRDDQVLKEMSDLEYAEDYFEKMYKDADVYTDLQKTKLLRPEIFRLNYLHKVKKFLNTKGPYRWSEFQELEKVAKNFQKANIKFIIVNNPENPLELNLYKDSDWYKDYLNFYSDLSSKYSVKFYDKKESIRSVQDFIDSHHLTYSGSMRMTEIYSSIIKENIR